MLRHHADIEKAHVKLWLSSTVVLNRILHASMEAFTATTKAEIERQVRTYAQNPSFKEAYDRLEKNHVIIISGPPGVGKTTLAEMLSFTYIGEEWDFVAIRSLEEGFAKIDDHKKIVFFFDDFLGRIRLDQKILAQQDSQIAKFIDRVRRSPNARLANSAGT